MRGKVGEEGGNETFPSTTTLSLLHLHLRVLEAEASAPRALVRCSSLTRTHSQQPGPDHTSRPARASARPPFIRQPINQPGSCYVPSTRNSESVSTSDEVSFFALLFIFFLSVCCALFDAGRFVGPAVGFVWALGSRARMGYR
jgi:hypothetical protein